MRVVTKPRVSESEKPAEKPKEEGEEVNTCVVLVNDLVAGLILHHKFACTGIMHYFFRISHS